jgi:hypothetical protein
MKTNSAVIEKWNKKIHIYLGLFFLLFLWIFCISGLFLNHPGWFAGKPQRNSVDKPVEMLDAGDQITKARHLMDQLDLTGEALFQGVPKPGQFTFVAMRPDERTFVNVNLETKVAKVTHVEGNFGQMLGNLHTFSGVRPIWREKESKRDWLPTILWSISIDALSIGVILLVMSSLYMGYRLKEKRRLVLASLGLGILLCSFFIWGLAYWGIA